jgi:2-aminoadipate transaminase
MSEKFAQRIKNAPRSFTRKILDLIQDNSVISFAGGLPDESLFPHKLVETEINNVLNNAKKSIYQYSSALGAKELREEIAKTYKNAKAEEILITTGSQQGLDLLCKAFIDQGDVIVVEKPSYLAALNLFALYDANIIEVSLTCKGVDTQELEEIFKTKNPKFFYTIPTFQNPTGWSWDEETRIEVAALATKYDVIIIEDSPYNALRYDGVIPTPFDELIPELSVSLGTFSKTLVPDFRLGWMRAKQEFLSVFQAMKENTDLQSSKFLQYVVANIMHSNKLSLHVSTLIEVYREKRDTMAAALQEEFKDEISFELPNGGMFFWVKFKESVDTMKLFDVAIKNSVAYVPGSVFYKKQPPCPYIRLNFTNATCEDIKEGIKRLKLAYMQYNATHE